ncbi:MAG TPA: hypothetical protein GX708_20880, partial [Gallicola sp.]|nr:hypothetical protein [Gallicola sp.]
SRIEPLILAEKYLIENGDYNKTLTDYKFYCFHGKPMYIFVFTERELNSHNTKRMIYNTDWEPLPEFINDRLPIAEFIKRPHSLDKMLKIAESLSEPFPFVRVDFYEIDNKPIFSELTFTPGHGTAKLSLLQKMGELVDISNIKVKNV